MNKYKPTTKQKELLDLLRSAYKFILAYGGSRSGKTRAIIELLVANAVQHANSRILILRLHFNHAKSSIWNDTLKQVLKRYDSRIYTLNNSDLIVSFWNGSEIIVSGADSDDRVEKLLGNEYVRIYINEASQITYNIFNLLRTRLAQKIDGLSTKMFIDANPPSTLHWLHSIFIERRFPNSDVPVPKDDFISFRINPIDNTENLPDDYIQQLEQLPENQRKRFLEGEWVELEGAIFSQLSEENIIDNIPDSFDEYILGVDTTGNNTAAVLGGTLGNDVYIIDSYIAHRMDPVTFNNTIVGMWYQHYPWVTAWCDPAAPTVNQLILYGMPAENNVEGGLSVIQAMLESKTLKIHRSNIALLSELSSYVRDEKGRIENKETFHLTDSLRYLVYSSKLHSTVFEEFSF